MLSWQLLRSETQSGSVVICYCFLLRTELEIRGSRITYGYDADGNRETTQDSNGGWVTNSYDANGRLESMVQIDDSRTTFSYDDAGRSTEKVLPNDTKTSCAYDTASRLTVHANKTSANQRISEFQFTYDDSGNQVSLLVQKGFGATTQPAVRITWM